jgi:hypothetical protein
MDRLVFGGRSPETHQLVEDMDKIRFLCRADVRFPRHTTALAPVSTNRKTSPTPFSWWLEILCTIRMFLTPLHSSRRRTPSWSKKETSIGCACQDLGPKKKKKKQKTCACQDVLWATLHKVVEPLLNHAPLHALREKACAEVMKQVHYEDENTRYIDIGPVNKASTGPCPIW